LKKYGARARAKKEGRIPWNSEIFQNFEKTEKNKTWNFLLLF